MPTFFNRSKAIDPALGGERSRSRAQDAKGQRADLTHFPFSLDIDDVLDDPPYLFAGRGPDQQRWLVALRTDDTIGHSWLCAPTSELAINCVRSGRAQAADVFRHSGTGSVEVITVTADGRLSHSVHLCADMGDDVLSMPALD